MYNSVIKRATYKPPQIKDQGYLISADPVAARVLDVAGALGLSIVFAPVMLLIAISIFLSNPGPVLFRQKRIGKDGKLFTCLKFRTMATNAEKRLADVLAASPEARAEWDRDHKLRNDPRVVGIGDFLRKSSLDELPQLLNVIAGDMSLVGPPPDRAGGGGKIRPLHRTLLPSTPRAYRVVADQRPQRRALSSADRFRRRVRPARKSGRQPENPFAYRAQRPARAGVILNARTVPILVGRKNAGWP